MSSTEVDPPTLSEIGRTLADFRAEMRGQLSQLVRADVYAAERANDQYRLQQLERDARTRDTADVAMRRTMVASAISAGVAIVVAIMTIIFKG